MFLMGKIKRYSVGLYYPLSTDVVEVRGIEPLSEDSDILFSPSASYLLGFPRRTADRQAVRFGSFILPEPPQSFNDPVPHINDAGELKP